jgi:DNA-binding Lrp family transcriptional regulator
MVTKSSFISVCVTILLVITLNYRVDELDRKIISHFSKGVYSYSELAEKCGVGRNTIYRRVNRLEAEGVIDKKVRSIPNFTKLNLSAICVMMDIAQSEVGKVIDFLRKQPQVKFLWRTFGAYNLTAVIICNKGEEGNCISNLREVLEKMRVSVNRFEASISFTWEKIDFAPF